MLVKATEEFLEAFEKTFQSKKTGCVRIFLPDFELHFFKISKFFSLFLTYNPIFMSYDHDIFYWRKYQGKADLSDTSNMFVKLTKNFLGALEKNFSTKNEKEIFGLCFELNFLLIFWTETFFHGALKNFLLTLRTCSR